MIIRAEHKASFTVIANEALTDERLSLEARGLLALLLSKPNNWNVSRAWIVKHVPNGDHTVRTALRELQAAGYYDPGHRHRDARGRFVSASTLRETPGPTVVDLPPTEEPPTVSPPAEEPPAVDQPVTNTEEASTEEPSTHLSKTERGNVVTTAPARVENQQDAMAATHTPTADGVPVAHDHCSSGVSTFNGSRDQRPRRNLTPVRASEVVPIDFKALAVQLCDEFAHRLVAHDVDPQPEITRDWLNGMYHYLAEPGMWDWDDEMTEWNIDMVRRDMDKVMTDARWRGTVTTVPAFLAVDRYDLEFGDAA